MEADEIQRDRAGELGLALQLEHELAHCRGFEHVGGHDAAHLLAGEELAGAPLDIIDLPVAYAAIPDAAA